MFSKTPYAHKQPDCISQATLTKMLCVVSTFSLSRAFILRLFAGFGEQANAGKLRATEGELPDQVNMEPLPPLEYTGVGQERILVPQDCGSRSPREETAGHRDRLAPRLEHGVDERAVHDRETH